MWCGHCLGGHAGAVEESLLSGQIAYYRRRAAEYDRTAYGDLRAARERIDRLVAAIAPEGDVLEIACGTGMWTGALARRARSLTALDAAPEAIAVARDRVADAGVTFVAADIFGWAPGTRFDVIFFSAWLSHVPAARFGPFWAQLATLLAEGGRVVFVDEHVDEIGKERYVPGSDEVITRTLSDGSRFSIVKNFLDPDRVAERLAALGWTCRIARDGPDWVVGEATPAGT